MRLQIYEAENRWDSAWKFTERIENVLCLPSNTLTELFIMDFQQ
jgi:hypothetical protein